MPEPGMGSGGSRSGAGMGGGGGYAGPELDWGMGPEGHETTEVGSRSSEDRDFDDVSPLDEKMAFMSSNPLGNPANVFATKTPTQPKVSFYLSEEFSPSTSLPHNRPVSPWAAPYRPVPSTGQPSFEEQEATYSQSGSKPGQYTRHFLEEGETDITSEVIGVLKNVGVPKEVMRALTVGGLPKLVIDEMESGTAASYHPATDTVTLGQDWTLGDLVHELAHRAAMHNTPGLDKIQMPNVQALYEVGGNALSPGYGAQGELVSSRAGTAQNFIDAQNLGDWYGPAGTGAWRDAYSFYDDEDDEWKTDYLGSTIHTRYGKELPHAAIKAGWSSGTPLAPKTHMGQYMHQLDEDDWVSSPAYNYYGANMANPNYSVPGTGDWKGGYENWMALQSEMPNVRYGAAMDFDGNFFGPASTTKNWGGGLWNAPMKGHNATVQEFVLRNKDMLEQGKYSKDVRQAMYNKFVAEELQRPPSESKTSGVAYAPYAKIGLIEKYGLAKEFWDKVGSYWDKFDQHTMMNQARKVSPQHKSSWVREGIQEDHEDH